MPITPLAAKVPPVAVTLIDEFSGSGLLGRVDTDDTNYYWQMFNIDIERVGGFARKVGYPDDSTPGGAVVNTGANQVRMVIRPSSTSRDSEGAILRFRDKNNYWRVTADLNASSQQRLNLTRIENGAIASNVFASWASPGFAYFTVIATNTNIRVFFEDSFSATLSSNNSTFRYETRHGIYLGGAEARINTWECENVL